MSGPSFTCGDCRGACCLCPPQLHKETEVSQALELGATVVATQREGKYYCCIVKENDRCPFLINHQCSVYETRFTVCGGFRCKALGLPLDEVESMDNGDKLLHVMYPAKYSVSHRQHAINPDFIARHGIKVHNQLEVLKLMSATNMSTIDGLLKPLSMSEKGESS